MVDQVELLKHAWTTEQLLAVDELERARNALGAINKSRDELRMRALEADWHRMRDVEIQWRDLTRYVVSIGYIVGVIVVIAAIGEYF